MWAARRFLTLVSHRGRSEVRSALLCQRGSLPELELRYLQCTCCWRSQVPVAGFETLNTSIKSAVLCEEEDAEKPLDYYYTFEQRSVILHLLNTATHAELVRVKMLRGRRSVNIVEYRDRNGPFNTLESVMNVPRLKYKSAVIVFNDILNPRNKEKKATVQFLKPPVERSCLEKASSIVSIVCGTNKIAWAHVDHGMTVLDWQQHECPNFLKGKYFASDYLSDISTVVSLLPPTDFYIIEKSSISVQNTTLFPIIAHMRTVEAMLFALLEPRGFSSAPSISPRVINMMRIAVGRHFGLMVGESRTSGARTVQRMMTESVTQKCPRVNIPQELLMKHRNAFEVAVRKEGDELCDALLQAVAFYELLSQSAS